MINENQWNSRIAFLLSMIGAAVGLGNIWRYSYVVYSNGGGTFFIPYLIAILIMGIPFLVLEYGIGFRHKDSFSNILKSINPKLEYISWALVLIIYLFYQINGRSPNSWKKNICDNLENLTALWLIWNYVAVILTFLYLVLKNIYPLIFK